MKGWRDLTPAQVESLARQAAVRKERAKARKAALDAADDAPRPAVRPPRNGTDKTRSGQGRAPTWLETRGFTVEPPPDAGHLKRAVLRDMPFPPSENEIYANAMGRGRVLTAKAKDYQGAFALWAMEHDAAIYAAASALAGTASAKIEVFLGLTYERLFTKAGRPRKIDGPNFVKLFLDCLTKVLGHDDSLWFECLIVKYAVPAGEPDAVMVKVSPLAPWTAADVERALE